MSQLLTKKWTEKGNALIEALGARKQAEQVVANIGTEPVPVYIFLMDEFARGPVTENPLFQFVYRSFYRLDNAGLSPEFKTAYFQIMEKCRGRTKVDIAEIVTKLSAYKTLKDKNSLQFSFATKLAATVMPETYPIYDAEVARCFGFRAPSHKKSFETRLEEYLEFYAWLRELYQEVHSNDSLKVAEQLFSKTYAPGASRVPPLKVLDFVLWSAGKIANPR